MQKLIDILKKINEESSLGGGITQGASMKVGPGEQVATTRFKKPVRKKLAKEDATMLAAGEANISTCTKDDYTKNPSIPNRSSKVIDYKQLYEVDEALINENYHQFKNKTKTRPKQDQFHQAVKEVKKKIAEANKLMEYVDRLQNELNEGEESLKYKKHTENAISQIRESVVRLYKKIKSFK